MGVPMPGHGPKDSDYYISLNRNKKGIVLDLANPEGADLARALARKSDIVVENFRPGVMDRLGFGFAALAALRPGLVYCSISAFGPTGPWSERPANDIIMQSVSGLMGITGPDHYRHRITSAAAAITCPVLFIFQLEDELFTRDEYLALFDALATTDKRMHANPGLHPAVPVEELHHSIAFLASQLQGTPPERDAAFVVSQ